MADQAYKPNNMASIRKETTFGVTVERLSRSTTPALPTPRKSRHDSLSRPVVPASPLLPPTGVSVPTTPVVATALRHSQISSPLPTRLQHVSAMSQVGSRVATPAAPSRPLSVASSIASSTSDMSFSQHEEASDLEAGTAFEGDEQQRLQQTPPAARAERFSNAATITNPTKAALVETFEYPNLPTRNPSAASQSSTLTAPRRTRTSDEKFAVDGRVRERNMWPSQEELRHKYRREKIMRSCNPLLRLSRRNQIIASIMIALLVIATAIGIGVGVSKAFHGGVWAGNGKSIPLPDA